MRHVKLIIAIAAVTFAAVFVVKHLMWMKGLDKGPEVKQLRDSSAEETVREEKKYPDSRVRMESPAVHEEEAAVVQEGHAPAESAVTAGQQSKRSDHAKSVGDIRPPREHIKSLYGKDAEEMVDYSGRRNSEPKKQSERQEPRSMKTPSITLKDNTVSMTLKGNSPPQTVKNPVRAINNSNNSSTQHATSTVPQ